MVNSDDRSRERARQDYVKVIYQLGQDGPVRAAQLARRLGVTRASVSKFKRMLEREELLLPARRPTDALRLTKKGQALALRMIRRHRLVETFLHRTLHVPLDRLHTEAERIEHAISDDVSTRLAGFLHHPITDPHGHAIPHGQLRQSLAHQHMLQSVTPGQSVIIASIDDRQPQTVRRLAALGVLPGMQVRVEAVTRRGTRVIIGRRTVTIPVRVAAAVRCTLLRPRQVA